MIADLQSPRGQGSGQSGLFPQRNQQLQIAAQVVLSSAGSVIGKSRSEIRQPLNPRGRVEIQNWIPPPIDEDLISTSTRSGGVNTIFSKLEKSQGISATDSATTLSVPQTAVAAALSPYSEVEDSFELEISQRLFVRGQKHYQSKDYDLARQCLTQAVAKVERLSTKSQRKLSAGTVKLLLAQAYLEMNKQGDHCIAINDKGEYICGQKSPEDLRTSEKLLLDLFNDSKKGFEELRVEASYVLCQVYSHQRRQQEAYDLCRRNISVLKAQKSTLWSRKSSFWSRDTAQSPQYMLYVTLLSQICKNKGDFIEAAAYDELLEEHRVQRPGNTLKKVAQDSGAERLDSKPLAATSDDKTAGLGVAQDSGAERLDSKPLAAISDDKTSGLGVALVSGADRLDSKPLAATSDDKTTVLGDAAMGAAHYTLEGHLGTVYSVAFSPNGRLVVSASGDKTLRLWDSATGAVRHTLRGHSTLVLGVAFSPDSSMVASSANDGKVGFWDSATGAMRRMLESPSDAEAGESKAADSVAFSPDGRLVASASDDGNVRLWDSATGALHHTLKGHSRYVNGVAFSPDGRLVASASGDSTVRLWDSATGALHCVIENNECLWGVAFSPDGRLIAAGSLSVVRLWDSRSGEITRTLDGGHSCSCVHDVAFSPNGRLVASASVDGTLQLWDSATGEVCRTLKGHTGAVYGVTFSPDGSLVASASVDKTVRLWEVTAGR